MGFRVGPSLWVAASFSLAFVIPIADGSSQALWQTKVAPDVQGRVFATRRLIAHISIPVSIVLSGVLADGVFEPALRQGGNMAPAFGWLVGSDPGSGMALMSIITGFLEQLSASEPTPFPLYATQKTCCLTMMQRLRHHCALTSSTASIVEHNSTMLCAAQG